MSKIHQLSSDLAFGSNPFFRNCQSTINEYIRQRVLKVTTNIITPDNKMGCKPSLPQKSFKPHTENNPNRKITIPVIIIHGNYIKIDKKAISSKNQTNCTQNTENNKQTDAQNEFQMSGQQYEIPYLPSTRCAYSVVQKELDQGVDDYINER